MNNLYRLTVYLSSFYTVSHLSALNYPHILYTAPETNLHNLIQCANMSKNRLSNTREHFRLRIPLENFHESSQKEQGKYCNVQCCKPSFTSADPGASVELLSSLRLSTNSRLHGTAQSCNLQIFLGRPEGSPILV